MSSVAHELPVVSSSAPAKHLAIRQAQVADAYPGEYSSTPGGTIFSTTPGGKIFQCLNVNVDMVQLRVLCTL